ncbi:MAG: ubiquitin-like domain-containing protein [Promethearchaeota archaeon]
MNFDDELDEDLGIGEPVKSKTPSSKTPQAGRKKTFYFISTIGPEKKEKLTVNDGNRIEDIKQTLGNLYGLDPNDFHLSSGGVTLDESDTLSDYNVNDGDDILLIPASTAG